MAPEGDSAAPAADQTTTAPATQAQPQAAAPTVPEAPAVTLAAPAAAPPAPAASFVQGTGKSPTPPPRPSIGRDVHFVRTNGDHAAAKVTRVHNSSTVNLTIFTDGDGVHHAANVPQFEPDVAVAEEHRPGTWHWPERV